MVGATASALFHTGTVPFLIGDTRASADVVSGYLPRETPDLSAYRFFSGKFTRREGLTEISGVWAYTPNTSGIVPTTITGDMHSINKANFAILHWFGLRFQPRFTDLDAQLKELYCADNPTQYEHCLVRPVGQIDLQVIVDERANIDQIIATLGLKEMTQGTLIRKLCTYTQPNPTRRAIFEFEKLVRSLYTLRYLRDPQLQRDVHRSQNRIESYHQLRSAIAQVSGKKELTI